MVELTDLSEQQGATRKGPTPPLNPRGRAPVHPRRLCQQVAFDDEHAPEQPTLRANIRSGKHQPIACEQCRRAKSKCDGQKPKCSRCLTNDRVCEYRTRSRPNSTSYTKLAEENKRLRLRIAELEKSRQAYAESQRRADEYGDNPSDRRSMDSQTSKRRANEMLSTWLPKGSVTAFGNMPMSSAIAANGYPSVVQAKQLLNFQLPEYRIMPLVYDDDSPLGASLLNFKELVHQMFAAGMRVENVLDVDSIDVELYYRDRRGDDPITAASWASQLARMFKEVEPMSRLAGCVMLTHLMRWMLLPTRENWERMPPAIRPVPSQRCIPHSATADMPIIPALREALLLRDRDYLSIHSTERGHIKIDWPYPEEDAVKVDVRDGRRKISRKFEQTLWDLRSVTFNECILEDFPEFEDLGGFIRRPNVGND